MGNKSLRIALKNDRVERVEELSLRIGKAVNDNIIRLGKEITEANEALEVIYGQTPEGMWKRFKKWVGGKK